MHAGLSGWAIAEDDGFDFCDMKEVPLLGLVAAGQPYQAFAVDETLSVPTTMWGGKSVFALRVQGNSMIDEGIHNGDYLIVEPRGTADNGQTVVAEIDGCVTVKKYFREADGRVRLQPANPEMLPLIVRGKQVRVIGVVTGVLRKFGFGERHTASAPLERPKSVSESAARGDQHVRRKPLECGRERAMETTPAAGRGKPPRSSRPVQDPAVIDLAVNVIDTQLNRWNAAIAHARQERRLRRHLTQMEELARDLQALRDWCARTNKPGLRRALLAEANKVIRRMQRFASVTPVRLPDLVLH
jgi:repressor LexA